MSSYFVPVNGLFISKFVEIKISPFLTASFKYGDLHAQKIFSLAESVTNFSLEPI